LAPLGEYAWFDVCGLVAGALSEHVAAVGGHGLPSLPAAPGWGGAAAGACP
jgi:hypothetical protein